MAELVPYESGTSLLHGKKASDYGIPSWRSKVMYVPQRAAIHPGSPMDLFEMAKKFQSQKGKSFGDPVSLNKQGGGGENESNLPFG